MSLAIHEPPADRYRLAPVIPGELPLIAIESEKQLVSLAAALGAAEVPDLSREEEALLTDAGTVSETLRGTTVRAIVRDLADPLGDAFCALRTPEERRPSGATYTPAVIIRAMIAWASKQPQPTRIVDVGTGSGRFLAAAGRAFPQAELIGSEIDPLAAITARGHLSAAGLAERSRVILGDYRELDLPSVHGQTLFIGNPPYVRHHLLGQKWKDWLGATAKRYGLSASKLAGLHVHFFLATAEHAADGDLGVFVTSAEWLDVNYGSLVRELLLQQLGVSGVHVIEPTALPFEDAATTAVITNFFVGQKPSSVQLQRVDSAAQLADLSTSQHVRRERLEAAPRWTPLTRTAREWPDGFIELGELCRVHRGQVTGMNDVWIADAEQLEGLPIDVLFPTVTKARELIRAGRTLNDVSQLRSVIDLPIDYQDHFDGAERKSIRRFLRQAKKKGAHQSYTALHRKAWYSVGLREPAPILATYMARRAPAFVRNTGKARHINIAHGLYPRERLSASVLKALAVYLTEETTQSQGRTYAGGLTKFEPKEMERLIVPTPDLLTTGNYREMMT